MRKTFKNYKSKKRALLVMHDLNRFLSLVGHDLQVIVCLKLIKYLNIYRYSGITVPNMFTSAINNWQIYRDSSKQSIKR